MRMFLLPVFRTGSQVRPGRASVTSGAAGRAAAVACLIAGPAPLAGCGEATPPAHLRIAGADAERGHALIASYGCGLCHAIDGVRGADGTVGPPLDDFAQRSLVAGIVPNTPAQLVAWLVDPPAIAPETGMPNMGISGPEARDMAAYLYTLGADEAQVYPDNPPLELQGREEPTLQSEFPASGGYHATDGAGGATPR
jgi:cytochrome c2